MLGNTIGGSNQYAEVGKFGVYVNFGFGSRWFLTPNPLFGTSWKGKWAGTYTHKCVQTVICCPVGKVQITEKSETQLEISAAGNSVCRDHKFYYILNSQDGSSTRDQTFIAKSAEGTTTTLVAERRNDVLRFEDDIFSYVFYN